MGGTYFLCEQALSLENTCVHLFSKEEVVVGDAFFFANRHFLDDFLDFHMLFLVGGLPAIFLGGVFLRFFCASQECPHAGTLAIILWIWGPCLCMFVHF